MPASEPRIPVIIISLYASYIHRRDRKPFVTTQQMGGNMHEVLVEIFGEAIGVVTLSGAG